MTIRRFQCSMILGLFALIASLTGGAASFGQDKKEKKNQQHVTLFEHYGFEGMTITVHKDIPQLAKRDFNDLASSLTWNLPIGIAAVLYSDNDFNTPVMVLVGSGELKDFEQHPDINDTISSVAFLPAGKNGYPKGIAKNLPKLGSE